MQLRDKAGACLRKCPVGIRHRGGVSADLGFGKCSIPDDCIDYKRYPLFMARSVMRALIEQLKAETRGVHRP